MKQWIFTLNELFDFKNKNFDDYTLFLKGNLGQRHDGIYICGTIVVSKKDIELINRLKEIYKDHLFLITSIDIKNKYIEFNQISTKQTLLKYLESFKD